MSDDSAAVLCGIGIGPGDPELITMKAFRLMNEAEIIFTPRARIKGDSVARGIAEASGITGANFIEMEFPMVTDKTELKEKWNNAAGLVSAEMKKVRRAVFITLGDPGIYSTWTYLQSALAEVDPLIKTETVAGISTMNAAAAALNLPLTTGRDRLALIPLPGDLSDLDRLTELFDTIVVYKVSNRLAQFCSRIESLGLSSKTSLVRRAGMADQELYPALTEIRPDTEGYLSTAIIRCSLGDRDRV